MSEINQIEEAKPTGNNPTHDQMMRHLRRANQIAKRALQFGHHPFGCILVASDNETILMEQGNIDTVNHAESTLARMACTNFSSEYLWRCTLYTTFEPCAMCAATLYWANIGQIVFGATEKRLLELTGSNENNPTLDIPCRYVFQHVQQINDLERDSIEKIRQTADEVRKLLLHYTAKHIPDIEIELNKFTDQLRQSRHENDLVETDLYRWKNQLIQLSDELNKPSNITIRQDSKSLVNRIYVDISTSKCCSYV
ncbi:unnamed protein product [Rotaria sp. Silwood1]|nr:unnamed protein product [Rotaria sp. Silwood1]CAF1488086.1 unnamed protein product [Rotaria sp. Silwood1]CAF3668866.1 unnamed protein product [Rotaria sp. Silwood1]